MITIGDMQKEYPVGITYYELAKEYQNLYENDIVAVFVDGKLTELAKKTVKTCHVDFVTTADDIGHKTYVRGLTMLLLKSVYALFGQDKLKKVAMEYAIGNGYYCDVEGDITLTEDSVAKIEARMRELVEENIRFEKKSVNTEEAMELFGGYGMYDKEKLFRYRRASRVNLYSLGRFEDYYYGAMPYSTGVLKYFRLEKYEDGLVLVTPNKKEPKKVLNFVPSPKLFHVFRESNDWGKKVEVDTVGALNDKIASGNLNELILTQEALHEKKIAQIAEDIYKKNKRLVMIAGPSSSGKTTFSYRLSVQLRTLGLKPHPIAVDNYFVNRENTPRDEKGELDFESIEALDIATFSDNILRLLKGEEVEIPKFSFETGQRYYDGEKLKINKNNVIIVEGIHGLNPKLTQLLPPEALFKIFVSALTSISIDNHNLINPTDNRLIRRMVRDYKYRNYSALETLKRWESVLKGEEKHIVPYQEEADIIFNSALIYELGALKQQAEPLLREVMGQYPEHSKALRLLKFFSYIKAVPTREIPTTSILREFLGGSSFKY